MKEYAFKPKKLPVISGYEAINILDRLRSGQLSYANLSLGKYKNVQVKVSGERVIFKWMDRENEQLFLELEIE